MTRGTNHSLSARLPRWSQDDHEELMSPTNLSHEPQDETSSHHRLRYSLQACGSHIGCFFWIPNYRSYMLRADLIAALSVASLYIPLSFSFAALGQVSPASSLWAFIIQPFIYALLGSSSQLVVGPEATGSLLVSAILHKIKSGDEETTPPNSQVAGLTTLLAGAMLFCAGSLRLGFLDCILSRPFMKGSICGVGFVLIVDQSLPELGLARLAKNLQEDGGSSLRKIYFVMTHLSHVHTLSAVFSGVTLFSILAFRSLQRKNHSKHPFLSYIPDRLIVLIVAATLTRCFHLQDHGLRTIDTAGSNTVIFPETTLKPGSMALIENIWTTSLMSALLGFFESSISSKSLRPQDPLFRGKASRPNNELVALGVANVLGGCFSTLPAYGGFGRSQLNAQTGGITPMSSIFLSLITLACLPFLSTFIVFVPRATLSALVSVVGIAMIEECLHDLQFFWRARAMRELFLMFAVFSATVAHSMSLGIFIGLGFTVYEVVRNGAQSQPRVVECSPNEQPNRQLGDDVPLAVIDVTQPLTFSNCHGIISSIKECEARWDQIYDRGGQPQFSKLKRCIIIDAQGLSTVDGAASQMLGEALEECVRNGARVVICGLSPSLKAQFRRCGIVSICGVDSFPPSLKDARQMLDRY